VPIHARLSFCAHRATPNCISMTIIRSTLCLAALCLPATAAFAVPSARMGVGAPKAALRPAMAAARVAPPARLPPAAGAAAVPKMAAAAAGESGGFMSGFSKFSDVFSNLFPLWTLTVACLGLFKPSVFLGISTEYFTGLLGLLMLSMGITLSVDDFKRVLQRPKIMILGFLGCYVLMPVLALGLSKALGLSAALTAGMVLVGSINGGQASNLCTYIAKGDVALSVLMTTATTLGAIIMTPLICKTLLGAIVPVDAVGVAISTIQVVLLPIIVGMAANAKFPKVTKSIEPFSPVVGVLSTCVLVGSAVAQCAEPIKAAGLSLQAAAALLHIIGGLIAYYSFKAPALGYDEQTARTVAIETSMKSSAFGFLLAKLHFPAFLVRVPAAVSVVWMALVGSSLAVLFRAMPVADQKK
jgi:BASS family bile acid:Na+ symporter